MELRGASVLLTGATGGLGAAIARRLRHEGASLVLSGRNREVLDALAAEIDAETAPCDLTDREQLHGLVALHRGVDIVVANAGVPASGELDSFSEAELDRIVEANLTAPIHLAHELSPAMIANGKGHLVFVSSLSGKVASPASSMYSATKFGLRGFSLALRQDLAPHGVGVSVVTPGFIRDAGMFARSGVEGTLPPGVGTCTPEDVAEATVKAITRNRAEVTVAPLPMKVGAAFGAALPRVSAITQKASGAKDIADRMAEGQTGWRA